MNQQAVNSGVLYMVASVFCFAIVNACAKSLHHLPVHELVFFRSVVVFVVASLVIYRKRISFFGNNIPWLLTRGITGLAALFLFFATIKHMPLASASTIQYLSPIFTVIAAISINKQKPRNIQWLLFLVSLLGVVVMKGFDHRISFTWLSAGVASAVLAGLAYNAVIRCKDTDHPMTIVLYFPMIAIPLMGVWCMFDWVSPAGNDWWLLLIMGLFTVAAQYLVTIALHSDVASKITPWNYTGAIFAGAFGYFLFHETINMMTVVGILLVVSGVVLNARVRMQEKN
jgi:drug/metabolite transporter (DMT)-like permease